MTVDRLLGMELLIVLLVGLLVGLALGVVGGLLLERSRQVEPEDLREDPALVEARHDAALAQVRHDEAAARARVENELASARASLEGVQREIEAVREQYRETVETHRREARQREAASESEAKVLEKLAPVTSQLRSMQQKVEEIEKQRAGQHSALSEQLRVSQVTAEKSRQAAEALSSALRNNSQRGAYGETQLTSLVESAGLLKRIDYSTQESITADTGARRPDMVVKLPGRKQMAIDAKVPFAAFIEAHETDEGNHRARLLKQHAKQVRGHVDALAGKEYWTGLTSSPEFTIAFIPNDAILNAALDADPALMEHAFGKGIVLATPVNLWAVLKTVAFTWKQEDLAEHAQEVVDLGRELYKRLGTLSSHVTKLGKSLERGVKDYNAFVGSLERGVLVTARKLDGFDDSALDVVEPVEVEARSLTRSEFTALEDLERPELDLSIEAGVVDDQRDAG